MAKPDGELTVAERLGRALDRGLLPAGGPAEAAERLIERLERPARIALLGLPGSGKSSILNLLVGAVVVPETLRLPTIVAQHGDSARMICTLTDGTTKILPGSDLAAVLPLAPALVTLEMDLAALKVISLLEVSAGPMEAEQKRAATWASKRADIVIWCTTSYLPKEQVVWESLPDAVKDNSFMFLTKVDLLGSRQQASAMHDRVELRAGEEFRQILSVSAKDARAALPPGGPANREMFRDSGAGAVIAAIKTRVQSGRRADTDTAELLLARHVEASELVARRFAESEAEAPRSWTPPPETDEELSPDIVTEPVAEAPEAETEADWDAVEVEDPVAEDPEPEEDAPEEADPEDDAPDVAAKEAGEEAGEETGEETGTAVEEQDELVAFDPEPEVETQALVAVDPPQQASRKRFADRIKRVASDADPSTPLVPLRSTWKSKAEPEAPPEPEPAPPAEPARRPRASAQPIQDEADVARMLATITSAPAAPVPAESVSEVLVPDDAATEGAAPADPTPEAVASEEPVAVRRERTPRAITPRPPRDVPAPDAPEAARPKMFGAPRNPASGLVRGTPLPDLSSLRARAEDAEEGDAADEAGVEPVIGLAGGASGEAEYTLDEAADFAPPPEPEPKQEPDPEPIAEAAPEPQPAAPVERPRLFGRDARPRAPEAVAEPAPAPRTEAPAPVPPASRLPASARAAALPVTPAATPVDDAQFSPRAIMMRERRTEPEAAAPRRERPRIAARAVPTSEAPAAPTPDGGPDQGLAAEAVQLIQSRTAALKREIDPHDKVPVDLILDHARETGEQLMTVVSRGKSEAMRRINSDLGEVLDLITLMQLEKGHAPADDALTMLLQLRRELETLRAA